MQPALELPPSMNSAAGFRAHAPPLLSRAPSATVLSAPSSPTARPSDFDLNPGLEQDLARTTPLRQAAVLVPVVARQPLTVLFTLRTEHLANHAGQVSFPGGKIDDSDASATATAIREAQEETALPGSAVEPLGFLDTYRTSTGYSVAPLVSLIEPGHPLRPNPDEVADIFEVPLSFLMDPANITLHSRMWLGRERRFYAFSYKNRYIWGATAGILNNMRERLYSD
ncbi:MAG: CoA pyrophosphatase [Hyphomicrobiaceae bacterium]|nr:CoA pyrophosphatase [Hyphomicrobiaceae bacterium]MCC0010643.1 CoA pyrophosphatase [Hyphomicrobiaceae bacterium]